MMAGDKSRSALPRDRVAALEVGVNVGMIPAEFTPKVRLDLKTVDIARPVRSEARFVPGAKNFRLTKCLRLASDR